MAVVRDPVEVMVRDIERRRLRYRFLTPIGRRIPPRGTLEWDFLVVLVAWRRVLTGVRGLDVVIVAAVVIPVALLVLGYI